MAQTKYKYDEYKSPSASHPLLFLLSPLPHDHLSRSCIPPSARSHTAMTLKRKLESEYEEPSSRVCAYLLSHLRGTLTPETQFIKQLKLVPFPNAPSDEDSDVMMTEAEPLDSPLDSPHHVRISSNASTSSASSDGIPSPSRMYPYALHVLLSADLCSNCLSVIRHLSPSLLYQRGHCEYQLAQLCSLFILAFPQRWSSSTES
jgi:hypothetical protein